MTRTSTRPFVRGGTLVLVAARAIAACTSDDNDSSQADTGAEETVGTTVGAAARPGSTGEPATATAVDLVPAVIAPDVQPGVDQLTSSTPNPAPSSR